MVLAEPQLRRTTLARSACEIDVDATTVEHPKVLTRPWTSAWNTYPLGSEDPIENFCTNNENIYQLRKLYELEKAQGKP